MAYTGRLRPRGVPIYVRLQLYGRVGISLVEVYKRVGKFVVAVCDRGYRSFRYRVVLIQLYSFEV